jgi:mRNA interferase MazF
MVGLDRMSSQPLDRGSIVTVAAAGVYSGKPRPAVVIQAKQWLFAHPSITLCPLTSTLVDAPLIRLLVAPSSGNGLTKPSQLMVDKLFTVPMAALGAETGRLESEHLQAMDQPLRGWLGLG